MIEQLRAPSGGEDITTPPAYLPNNRGALLRNMLPGSDGRVRLRGGIAKSWPQPIDSVLFYDWAFEDTVLAAWQLPGTDLIGPSGGWGTFDPATGGTTRVSEIKLNTTATHARLGSYVYGVGYTDIKDNPSRKPPGAPTTNRQYNFARWDGGSASGALVTYANAPVGPGLAAHLGRIFVLTEDGTLRWSDPGGPTADTAAAWQDDVSGLDNKIVLEGSKNDVGVGLANVGGRLAIIRRRSVYLLTGTSPATFAVKQVLSLGCNVPGAILEFGEGAFFASDEGLVYFDGAQVRRYAGPVDIDIVPAAYDGSIRLTQVQQDHVIVVANSVTHVLHVPSGSWWQLTLPNGLSPEVMRTANYVLGYADTFMWDLSRITQPESYTSGNFDLDTLDAKVVPAADVRTRLARLATPGSKATIQRIMVDYTLAGPVSAVEWAVYVEDGQGNNRLAQPFILPQSSSRNRQRAVLDCPMEADEVLVRFVLRGLGGGPPPSSLAITTAEIHDTWIDYKPAQQR